MFVIRRRSLHDKVLHLQPSLYFVVLCCSCCCCCCFFFYFSFCTNAICRASGDGCGDRGVVFFFFFYPRHPSRNREKSPGPVLLTGRQTFCPAIAQKEMTNINRDAACNGLHFSSIEMKKRHPPPTPHTPPPSLSYLLLLRLCIRFCRPFSLSLFFLFLLYFTFYYFFTCDFFPCWLFCSSRRVIS